MSANRHISLPKTFASGDVGEWFKRFEICCSANEWNDTTQAAKLPTLLEGEALAIWLELSEDTQKDYKEAKKKIVEKMAPQAFVSLDDFHKRRLHPGEPISVYVHELKKLLDQAMPGLDTGARDQLLLHQFLAGIPRDISKPIRAASDVKSLDQAMERARLLMAVDSEGPSPVAAVSDTTAYSTQLQELQGQISELTEQVAMLSTQRRAPSRSSIWCHNCGGIGHMRRECPTRRRVQDGRHCFNCCSPSHMQRDCPLPRRGNPQGNDRGTTAPGNSRPYQVQARQTHQQ